MTQSKIILILGIVMIFLVSCSNRNYISDDGELYCNEEPVGYKGDLLGFKITMVDSNYGLSQEEINNLCKIVFKPSKEIDNSLRPYLNVTYTECPENYLCLNISEIPDNATILEANLTLIKEVKPNSSQ